MLVALAGPAIPRTVDSALREAGAIPVHLSGAAADSGVLRHTVAMLACDAVVVVLKADVGVDPATAQLWQQAQDAGLPRAVLVAGLAPGRPDFDDLAAIAERVLGDECIPVRLPVLDDDEQVVASLDLSTGALDLAGGRQVAEAGHLDTAAGDIERLGAHVEMLGYEPGIDVGAGLALAVRAGEAAPVLAATPDQAWVVDLTRWWRDLPATTRLVRRDIHDEPCLGTAAVVLAADAEAALVREPFGDDAQDATDPQYNMLTRPGSDAAGGAAPYRAWPVAVTALARGAGTRVVRCSLQPHVGDALAEGHLWVVPARDV